MGAAVFLWADGGVAPLSTFRFFADSGVFCGVFFAPAADCINSDTVDLVVELVETVSLSRAWRCASSFMEDTVEEGAKAPS